VQVAEITGQAEGGVDDAGFMRRRLTSGRARRHGTVRMADAKLSIRPEGPFSIQRSFNFWR
jgi:hypothetical protein